LTDVAVAKCAKVESSVFNPEASGLVVQGATNAASIFIHWLPLFSKPAIGGFEPVFEAYF
jgi:hypothetical protein